MFPAGDIFRRMAHPIFALSFGQISANRISAPSQSDPLTDAPTGFGAIKATRRNFRICGVGRELQVPGLTRDYEVWSLPERPVQVEGNIIGAW